MRWFRLYDEIIDDPKMSDLSDFQFRCFVNLMSMASQSQVRGVLMQSHDQIAWRLRVRKNLLLTAINKLIELGILARENNELRFINWDKRQFKSDDVTSRVKRYRNVSVTPPDTDTDTDTDKKKEIKKKPAGKRRPTSDDEWLESLKSNPAYAGLDVLASYNKMLAWCQVNNKSPTRRRFVNWLNREEKPMEARPGNGTNQRSGGYSNRQYGGAPILPASVQRDIDAINALPVSETTASDLKRYYPERNSRE